MESERLFLGGAALSQEPGRLFPGCKKSLPARSLLFSRRYLVLSPAYQPELRPYRLVWEAYKTLHGRCPRVGFP